MENLPIQDDAWFEQDMTQPSMEDKKYLQWQERDRERLTEEAAKLREDFPVPVFKVTGQVCFELPALAFEVVRA